MAAAPVASARRPGSLQCIGFGLYAEVGAAAGIALLVFPIQVPLSMWWLGRHQYGPTEWAWRRLTYRVPLALNRPSLA